MLPLYKKGGAAMALTTEFKNTIKKRTEEDESYRLALFKVSVESMLAGDIQTGKKLLRDYINATIGFEELGQKINKSPKSLMRMLSETGNPTASNIFQTINFLKELEGIELHFIHA